MRPTGESFTLLTCFYDWAHSLTGSVCLLYRFRMALELSLFYSPRLAGLLRDLAFACQTYMHKSAPPVPPASLAAGTSNTSLALAIILESDDRLRK